LKQGRNTERFRQPLNVDNRRHETRILKRTVVVMDGIHKVVPARAST